MALINPPAWLQQGSYPAISDRRVLAGFIGTEGVVDDPGYFVVTPTTTPSLTFNVSAGHAYVEGTSIANQGIYHVFNDGPVSLTLNPADATRYRVDAIILRVYDAEVSGTRNEAVLEVLTGPVGALGNSWLGISPIPASAIEIARILVAPGATALNATTITQQYKQIASFRRNLTQTATIVTSTTRPPAGNVFSGMQIYETDTRRTFVWDSAFGDWFKISGPETVVLDTPSFGSNAVVGTNGTYTLGWNVMGLSIPYAGMLKIDVTATLFATANAAGYWAPVSTLEGGAKVRFTGIAPRRFSNGGQGGSLMPGGHLHIEVPVRKNTGREFGVEFTVDPASAPVSIHVGGSQARITI